MSAPVHRQRELNAASDREEPAAAPRGREREARSPLLLRCDRSSQPAMATRLPKGAYDSALNVSAAPAIVHKLGASPAHYLPLS